jgi:hypothetical protein
MFTIPGDTLQTFICSKSTVRILKAENGAVVDTGIANVVELIGAVRVVTALSLATKRSADVATLDGHACPKTIELKDRNRISFFIMKYLIQ